MDRGLHIEVSGYRISVSRRSPEPVPSAPGSRVHRSQESSTSSFELVDLSLLPKLTLHPPPPSRLTPCRPPGPRISVGRALIASSLPGHRLGPCSRLRLQVPPRRSSGQVVLRQSTVLRRPSLLLPKSLLCSPRLSLSGLCFPRPCACPSTPCQALCGSEVEAGFPPSCVDCRPESLRAEQPHLLPHCCPRPCEPHGRPILLGLQGYRWRASSWGLRVPRLPLRGGG